MGEFELGNRFWNWKLGCQIGAQFGMPNRQFANPNSQFPNWLRNSLIKLGFGISDLGFRNFRKPSNSVALRGCMCNQLT